MFRAQLEGQETYCTGLQLGQCIHRVEDQVFFAF